MIERRPFAGLGGANHGWLKAKHHFSFAGYYDPERMGWGNLRVWNDDEIAPKAGFPPHPHADMEIITYVRDGAITHKDSMGNIGRTEAGDVQVMSAGPPFRIQPGRRNDPDLPDLDPAHDTGWDPVLGRQTVSESRALRSLRDTGQRVCR